jgi:NAD(P)H dehydrogenase (quinone)
MSDQPTLLVTGASGKLGREVVRFLLDDHGVSPGRLIVTTRDPARLTSLAERGVDVRAADFDDPASLTDAFAGADALLLISVDTVGRRVAQHTHAIAAAEAAGVQHLVYTSMPAPADSPLVFAPEHAGTEARLADSAVPVVTVLRNNWYFENLTEFQASILQTGVWLTAADGKPTAELSRLDLARAAAAALVSPAKTSRTLTLHGRESLTVAERAKLLADAIGRSIEVVALDDAAYRAALTEAGVPAPFIEMMATMEAHNGAGLSDGDSGAFEALTGTRPQSLAAWVDAQRDVLRAVAGTA